MEAWRQGRGALSIVRVSKDRIQCTVRTKLWNWGTCLFSFSSCFFFFSESFLLFPGWLVGWLICLFVCLALHPFFSLTCGFLCLLLILCRLLRLLGMRSTWLWSSVAFQLENKPTVIPFHCPHTLWITPHSRHLPILHELISLPGTQRSPSQPAPTPYLEEKIFLSPGAHIYILYPVTPSLIVLTKILVSFILPQGTMFYVENIYENEEITIKWSFLGWGNTV